MNTGLSLQRTVTTVNAATPIYLIGNFPQIITSGMTVTYQQQNYPISNSNTFNVSLGSSSNPNNVSDSSTIPMIVTDGELIAYQGNTPYTPVLTALPLSSLQTLNIPSTLNISQSTNISLTLSSQPASSLTITLPIIAATLDKCCIDPTCSTNKINHCYLSTHNNKQTLNIDLLGSTVLSSVIFTITTIAYQTIHTNYTAVITIGLPSASIQQIINITVKAKPLLSTLTL